MLNRRKYIRGRIFGRCIYCNDAFFDKRYFHTYGIDIRKISAFVFDAGQPTTHFNVLRERGMDSRRCIIDDAAPLYYVEEYNNQPSMLIFCSENVHFEYLIGHRHCD